MGTGKIGRPEALLAANDILGHLTPALEQGVVAGSIRREKPVVGDIEIVGLPSDRELLVKLVSDIGEAQVIKPGVPDIIPWTAKVDAKYIRLYLASLECKVDIFLADRNNFGGILAMRTGSASGPDGNAFHGFIPGCFSRWKKLSGGGRMNGAMPTTAAGEILPVPTEEAFFARLEMTVPPPAERATKGCIKKYATS